MPDVPFFLFFLVILIIKTHFKDISCMDFHNFLKEQPNLLEEIQSSKRYDKDVSRICPGPSAQKRFV
jgi:hypothetical protein